VKQPSWCYCCYRSSVSVRVWIGLLVRSASQSVSGLRGDPGRAHERGGSGGVEPCRTPRVRACAPSSEAFEKRTVVDRSRLSRPSEPPQLSMKPAACLVSAPIARSPQLLLTSCLLLACCSAAAAAGQLQYGRRRRTHPQRLGTCMCLVGRPQTIRRPSCDSISD
jgi:hypothetical protein